MPKPLNDMSPGQRFGKLTLIEKCAHPNPKRREKCWRVKCDCGNERIVFPSGLRKGATASCGCGLRKMYIRRKSESNVALTRVRNVYKNSARIRGIEWFLEDELFEAIIAYPCSYCGARPSNKTNHRDRSITYTGIDRIDNSLGYIPGNVIPCCFQCNQAKSTFTLKQFADWSQRVAEKTSMMKIEEDA
jgi:hypothetical protein